MAKITDRIRNAVADFLFPPQPTTKRRDAVAEMGSPGVGVVWSLSYNGEKNTAELGPAIDYHMDYEMLRIRSWQSYVESEITKTVIDRFIIWIVGTGLKLQASPNLEALATEGVTEFNKEARDEFARTVEARFRVFAASKYTSYDEQKSLADLEVDTVKTAILGGDCLIVLRLEKGQVKVQLIDGANISTPMVGQMQSLPTGNRIRNGVEIDERGRHVAYWVRKKGEAFEWERVEAVGKKSKQRLAFMVYGSKFRCNSTRGVPLIAGVLETLKKLERYKEATVGSAEERQKIVYQIVHEKDSTGESPLLGRIAHANDPDGSSELPTDSAGNKLARTVAVSTDKQTFNMTQGSELKILESKNELYFKEFYDTNFDIVCATIGIPPNVARMLYNDSYSASRAALKDWEHTLRVGRHRYSTQFNDPVYSFWLWAQVLGFKVKAPGYLDAVAKENRFVIEAISKARWTGANVPHIDPLKEVKAERAKLGPLGNNMPLATLEAATENLSEGEASENIVRFAEERASMDDAGLPADTITAPPDNNNDGSEGDGNSN